MEIARPVQCISVRQCAQNKQEHFFYVYLSLPNLHGVCVAGELIADDDSGIDVKSCSTCTKYRLVGVVVHSGQASGGHYYSYILHRYVRRVSLCTFMTFRMLCGSQGDVNLCYVAGFTWLLL